MVAAAETAETAVVDGMRWAAEAAAAEAAAVGELPGAEEAATTTSKTTAAMGMGHELMLACKRMIPTYLPSTLFPNTTRSLAGCWDGAPRQCLLKVALYFRPMYADVRLY